MTRPRRLAALALLTLALIGCNEGEREGGATSDRGKKPDSASTADAGNSQVMPYEVAADAIAVGTTLNGNDVVRAQRMQFTTADTVYAGTSVKGAAPGANAVVFWTYQDGRATQESKRIEPGQATVWFAFSAEQGMKPGKYNVEIDINSRPVGIVDFEVR